MAPCTDGAFKPECQTPNIDALLEVRDIGLEEGPATRAASPDRLAREVVRAARKLSRDMLPKRVEDPIEIASRDSQASTVPGEASRLSGALHPSFSSCVALTVWSCFQLLRCFFASADSGPD
ncbi:unnamed protein product [Symbiodinium sp. CCMP2592]|nr:unnamed protein product [Symbiodinium sp. CCMP2592]